MRAVRLSGTVEAVEATTIATPRLAGPNKNSLVITKLVKPGTTVEKGDLLVEFDRQTQIATALDRRAELNDLEQQIRKKEAAERAARVEDDSKIMLAESALSRARLETVKNEMLPKIQAEKNDLALEEAQATLKQLKTTYELKRQAADADIQILEIRRDRAENAMRQAETNAERMAVHRPDRRHGRRPDDLEDATTWRRCRKAKKSAPACRSSTSSIPAPMRVRARVNQADINELQSARPSRSGSTRIPSCRSTAASPRFRRSAWCRRSRRKCASSSCSSTSTASHPNLMPDLTASLDVKLARVPGALVVPRDAVGTDGEQDVSSACSAASLVRRTAGDPRSRRARTTGRGLRRRRRRGRRPQRRIGGRAPVERRRRLGPASPTPARPPARHRCAASHAPQLAAAC